MNNNSSRSGCRESGNIICFKPFTALEVHTGGGATFCCYIKNKIGNLRDHDVNTVFNSDAAQDIRKAFYDGSYSCCDKQRCELFGNKVQNKAAMHEYLTDEIMNEIDQRKTVLSHGPRYIVESAHGVCNVKCRFCIDFTRFPRNTFVSEGYSAIFDTIESLNHVMLAGGEPLYNGKVNKLLEELINRNISLSLHTNFSYIDSITKSLLSKVNIKHINISLNAAHRDTYEYLVQGAKWERTLDNIGWFNALNAEGKKRVLTFSMVVNNRNFSEIDDFVKLTLGELKGDRVSLYPMSLRPSNAYLALDARGKELALKLLKVFDTSDFQEYRDRIDYFGLRNSLAK